MFIAQLILPYILATAIGYFAIHIIFFKEETPALSFRLLFGFGIGLGISAYLTFTSYLFFNQLMPTYCLLINALLLFILILFHFKQNDWHLPKTLCPTPIHWPGIIPFIILLIFAQPLWYQSYFYANGGWDAWSTWNLKARMMYLGQENWRNMFDPVLWRSSPHYPLLLPLINVWGWLFLDHPSADICVLTAYLFTFLTVCLLFFALKHLTKTWVAILPALILLTLKIFNKLSLSQYSDNVLGFYLLASLFSLIMAKTKKSSGYGLLAGIFLGLLSFSKSEGLIAALIIGALSFPYLRWQKEKAKLKQLLVPLLIGAAIFLIPTVIFKLIYSPGNQTFINGFFSQEAPADFNRLRIILAFYLLEIGPLFWNIIVTLKNIEYLSVIPLKWSCIWLFFFVGMILSFKKCFNRATIILPVFLISYWGIITIYYWMNTHFNIEWWLQVTLHRIMFAVLPVTFFWCFYALWYEEDAG